MHITTNRRSLHIFGAQVSDVTRSPVGAQVREVTRGPQVSDVVHGSLDV